MPLTKEERHALATRVRLGEVLPEGYPNRHHFDKWRNALTLDTRIVLGVCIARYKRGNWYWEDGCPVPDTDWDVAIMEYLERE